MRSGTALWRSMGLVLLTAACSAPAGVAGVSTESSGPRPSAVPSASHVAAPVRPTAADPVRLPPPKVSPYKYAFPVAGCHVTYARKLLVLPKTTIWAAKGCAFVAPVAGVVREVNIQNRWAPSTDRGADREGRFVTVLGDDGVLYLGGHLDSVEAGIRPGVKVKAGQRLGRVGNSGNARDTGPNLYFAITWVAPPKFWWIRRGMVEPWNYLDAWWAGNPTFSPRAAMASVRKRVGALPACSQLCAGKPPAAQPHKTHGPNPEIPNLGD
ncbi:M23 family metallopeptidase [Streptosporangiaceae bacterium NEAU-GS5]|nr:M23 family metallopeptidase [Streptosporangiaceae bacterium NEAU-GS5]